MRGLHHACDASIPIASCVLVQACVLASPMGVIALMDLLGQPLEVLRNEALLLLVGLCNGCPQIANIAAFEGAFEKLLAICGAEGGPAAGDVIVQDGAELMNNLLRDNLANQRLFRWVRWLLRGCTDWVDCWHVIWTPIWRAAHGLFVPDMFLPELAPTAMQCWHRHHRHAFRRTCWAMCGAPPDPTCL